MSPNPTVETVVDTVKTVAGTTVQMTLEEKVAKAIAKLEKEIASTKKTSVRIRDTFYLALLKTAGPEIIGKLITQIEKL